MKQILLIGNPLSIQLADDVSVDIRFDPANRGCLFPTDDTRQLHVEFRGNFYL
jgi:hypothetical protein